MMVGILFFAALPRMGRMAALALSLALVACTGVPSQRVVPPAPNSVAPRAAPPAVLTHRWMGRYMGRKSSCPSSAPVGCAGMDLLLVLNADNTYSLTTTMLRRDKPYSFTSRGRFQWDASGNVITLASKDENTRLRIGNGFVERIGGDGLSEENAARQPLVLRKM